MNSDGSDRNNTPRDNSQLSFKLSNLNKSND